MIVNEHGLNWYHLSPRFPLKNVIVNVYGGFEWQRQFRHLSRTGALHTEKQFRELSVRSNSLQKDFAGWRLELCNKKLSRFYGPAPSSRLRLLRLLLSTSPRVIRLTHLLMRKNVQLNSHRTVTKIFADTTASASHSCTQKRRSCLKKELPRFRGPAP
jgi:hypothetical protein